MEMESRSSESIQKEDLAPQRNDSQNSEIQVKQERREAVLERDVTKKKHVFHVELVQIESSIVPLET